MNPASVLKDLLVAGNAGTFNASTGWNITLHSMPEAPNQCITLYNSGGRSPNPAYQLDFPSVQVMIRGNVGDGEGAYAQAVKCKDLLLGVTSQDVIGGRLMSVTLLGDINALGWDEKSRPRFSINVNMITEPDVSADSNRVAL